MHNYNRTATENSYSMHIRSANMTMGIDMSPVFSEVVSCMNIQVLEIKKMVCAAEPRQLTITKTCALGVSLPW